MASTFGRSSRDLIEEITEDASRFGFFQTVRLLALSAENNNGQSIPKALRFGTPLSLAFPASEIVGAKKRRTFAHQHESTFEKSASGVDGNNDDEESDPLALLLTVGFMGLTGPSGILPQAYTELLIDRRNNYRDDTAHSFLDLFCHRLISLFYATWRKRHFYLDYEAGERDRFNRNVLDLVGMGSQSLQARLKTSDSGVPDSLFAYYAGLMAQKPISAVNLAAVLRGYFLTDVAIDQFVGQWIAVPEIEQSCLGRWSCKLGEDTFAGGRLWDRQTKIRLTLGPLTETQFADFLPGQSGHVAMLELVQFAVGHTLACDVTLKLKRQCVPMPVLSSAPNSPLRLGYNTWLLSSPPQVHLSDTHYHLLA